MIASPEHFDFARAAPDVGERHIRFETAIVMQIDETDQRVTVPLRAVFTDDGLMGWSFEIGPYSVADREAAALINSLAHYGRLSGDFVPASPKSARDDVGAAPSEGSGADS